MNRVCGLILENTSNVWFFPKDPLGVSQADFWLCESCRDVLEFEEFGCRQPRFVGLEFEFALSFFGGGRSRDAN